MMKSNSLQRNSCPIHPEQMDMQTQWQNYCMVGQSFPTISVASSKTGLYFIGRITFLLGRDYTVRFYLLEVGSSDQFIVHDRA